MPTAIVRMAYTKNSPYLKTNLMKKYTPHKTHTLAMLCVAPLNLFTLFLPPFGFICGGMSVAVGLYWDKGAFMSLKEACLLGMLTGALGGCFAGLCGYGFYWFLSYFIDGNFGNMERASLANYMQLHLSNTNYIFIGNLCLTMISNTAGGWFCLRFLHSYRILPKEIDERWTQ